MKMKNSPIRVEDYVVKGGYEGYRYVDDPNNSDAIEAPEHLYRYDVVEYGDLKNPSAKIVGHAVSIFDLPDYRKGLYPFHAYTRLAERLGISIDENALEKQWNQRFNRIHRRPRPERVRVDISGWKYYRNLIRWYYKQPSRIPSMPKRLKSFIENNHPQPLGWVTPETRKERQKEWDTFVEQCLQYKERYLKWFSEKPVKTGLPFALSDKSLYCFDGHELTKESIERIEQTQMMKSCIRIYPPFGEELVTVLEI
jgi:hypothetical protein